MLGFEHHKEHMIHELQNMKQRADETIQLIEKAETEKELLIALIESPMGKSTFK